MSNDLKSRLEREEGRRQHMYKDSKGIWTVGIGYNIEEKGLPNDIIDILFDRTMSEASSDARKFPAWEHLNYARKSVLVAMVFQMGHRRVSGFKKALAAMEAEDWQEAHNQMLDSKWARDDSPGRAQREATIMLAGEL